MRLSSLAFVATPTYAAALGTTTLDGKFYQKQHLSFSPETLHEIDVKTNSCTLSATESCSLDHLSHDTSTLIYPGGSTSCIDSEPFAFQVYPGSSDNLLIYFQGGGCCWDQDSYELGLCSKTLEPYSQSSGVFCRNGHCSSSEDNPFEDYTIVVALYCSGDAFVGDVARPDWSRTNTVVQRGSANVQSIIDYVTGQFTAIDSLVLMGCSAGSLGVQANANNIFSELESSGVSYERSLVVPDSYAGVFPPDTESFMIKDFGACETPAITSDVDLKTSCDKGTITLGEIVIDAMVKNSEVSPN